MSENPIPTRFPNPGEKILRDKFYEAIAAQDELMSKLAGQLLTLELAIPGIYATVLKFIGGDETTIQLNPAFYLTYGAWLIALGLTLSALFPKDWKVDPTVLIQDPAKYGPEGRGIEDFFRHSARHKRRLLIASSIFFFLGVFFAGFTI